jgi:hypothetical protein
VPKNTTTTCTRRFTSYTTSSTLSLKNQLHPYVPPGAAEMDLDEDEDPKDPEALAEDDDVDADHGDVSNLDSDHDE